MVELPGRTDELQRIDSLLAGRAAVEPCLLLRGEPGIGKTALLDAAAARAEAAGMLVLRAAGVRSEAGIGFSAVHQLLYPLHERAGARTAALHGVLDLARAGSLDPVAVATAVLALLGEVGAERPVLLAVDDVPDLDDASARVLSFVARRLAGTRAVFLAAARNGPAGLFDGVGLPELEVGPLAEPPSVAVLDAARADLAPPVRRRLLDEAGGNPLSLRELPGALSARQRLGREPLPEFLPLSGRLEAALAPAAERLPAPTRRLLLLAALAPGAEMRALLPAAQGSATVEDLEPARRAGLVRTDPVASRIVFRPPVLRSAIVQLSRSADRRWAHRALAERADAPSDRAWHLAEATQGPDEAVATALEQAFLSDFRSGRAAAAVTALVRAADLSPCPADRSRRLIEAAYLASSTGPLERVPQLLADARMADQARSAPEEGSGSVFAAATAVYLFNADGDVDGAYRLLSRALEDAAAATPTGRWVDDLLSALLFVCIYAARPDFWDLLGGALARLDAPPAAPLRLCYDAFTYPARTFSTVRDGVARAFAALPAGPRWLIPLAFAALRLDVLCDYRHLCRRMIDEERDGGSNAVVLAGLLLLSTDSFHHGQWDESEALAREGLELATAYGYHLLKAQLRIREAFVQAGRGDAVAARALTDEVTTWAVPRGLGLTQAFARHARVIAALTEGDYEDAYAQASWISRPEIPSTGIPGRWLVLDLVEADVHTGRAELARAHVAAARQAGLFHASPRTELIAAGAAALAAADDEAGPLFEAAVSLPEADRWPWEQARIHLAYGRWLRRTRDTSAARLYLRAAEEAFDRLGARPWTQRARHELRAAGVATARPERSAAALTAQERQIAELAATGMTNKQIGERLFLSHRTVGAHLHRLFPKLGITSRAALRDALQAVRPQEPPPPS
ncbi:MAG TPA: LuxR family transcriptional regulator [Dactylosporangium sp.]|nr:LuxR family transcriptional regulator [Dactylosporangium sp.]